MNRLAAISKQILLSLLLMGGMAPLCFAASNGESLRYLKDLKKQNTGQLNNLNRDIHKSVEQIHALVIQDKGLENASEMLAQLENNVLSFRKSQSEHLLRQEFLDRLIFQIDSQYLKGDLKSFLHLTLKKMAHQEASSSLGKDNMWKFLSYLGVAINNLPERNEDPLAFIEGYLNFSGISNPIRPDQYISLRDYTNGIENETAETMSLDSVGDHVELKLVELEKLKAEKEKKKVFELRQPVLKGVTQEKISNLIESVDEKTEALVFGPPAPPEEPTKSQKKPE